MIPKVCGVSGRNQLYPAPPQRAWPGRVQSLPESTVSPQSFEAGRPECSWHSFSLNLSFVNDNIEEIPYRGSVCPNITNRPRTGKIAYNKSLHSFRSVHTCQRKAVLKSTVTAGLSLAMYRQWSPFRCLIYTLPCKPIWSDDAYGVSYRSAMWIGGGS